MQTIAELKVDPQQHSVVRFTHQKQRPTDWDGLRDVWTWAVKVDAMSRHVMLPAANSSMVMRGKRMRERALPRQRRLFSGVGWNCCRCASASAQRTAAANRRTSRTPSVSRSNTATRVSVEEGETPG